MRAQIDKLYVYRPSKKLMEGSFTKLDHRHVDGQEITYRRGNILEKSDSMHRYAKTVTINGIPKVLILLTLDSDKKRVSKFFTDSKSKIKNDDALLGIFARADNKPIELGVTYVY